MKEALMSEKEGVPLVVGIGGTVRPGSSSEQALRTAMRRVEERGLRTTLLAGETLLLPMYDPFTKASTFQTKLFVDTIRGAAGVIIASPCYHGSLSGLIKNSLDYIEDTSGDPRPYLDGKSVGLIGCGFGTQGPTMVLTQLRAITHSLRGWPVPMGVVINSAVAKFYEGSWNDDNVFGQLQIMADQVVDFIQRGAYRPNSEVVAKT